MADISSYIQDFANAVYGEDVRSSMIELAQAVNDEVESNTSNVSTYTTEIRSKMADVTATQSSVTKMQAEVKVLDANANAYSQISERARTESASSSKESKSYAVGGTNSRTGEETDNAKYYCESASASKEACDDAVAQAQSLIDAANAQVAGWQFYIKEEDANLYVNTSSTSNTFGIDEEDGYIYVEV